MSTTQSSQRSVSASHAQTSEQSAALVRLRLATVEVALSPKMSRDALAASRRELAALYLKANRLVRDLEASYDDELFQDVCFGARVGIADVRRALTTESESFDESVSTAKRARLALHRSLVLLTQAVALFDANVERRAGRPAPVNPWDAQMATLQTMLRAATHANPEDAGWVLEVSQAEFAVLTVQSTTAAPLENTRALCALQTE